MKRTNIYLEEELDRLLRHVAVEEGRSFTGIVREALCEYLERRGIATPAPRVVLPDESISQDEWRANFNIALERFRANLPTDVSPEEIDAEIDAAVEEARAERRAHRMALTSRD